MAVVVGTMVVIIGNDDRKSVFFITKNQFHKYIFLVFLNE